MNKITLRSVISNSGFGTAAQGMIKTAIAAGYDVKFIPVNAFGLQHRKGFTDEDLAFYDSISITDKDHYVQDSILIDVGSLIYGKTIPKLACKKHILYCTYETVKISQDYVDMMNHQYDEVWTASNFNKISFASSGVAIDKIKIIPHYIDFTKFPQDAKPFAIKNKRKFNFLYNADISYRKGLHLLLPAFAEVFDEDEDVSLTLKLTMATTNIKQAPAIVESLNRLLFTKDLLEKPRAPILLIVQYLTYDKLASLYNTANCYISPTLGEGFAITIAESMALGIPQICTRCSAPLDYLNRKNCKFIELDDKNPTKPITDQWQIKLDPGYRGQSLYNPSYNNLKEIMRDTFDNQKQLIDMGINAKNDIYKYGDLTRLANIFKELIQ